VCIANSTNTPVSPHQSRAIRPVPRHSHSLDACLPAQIPSMIRLPDRTPIQRAAKVAALRVTLTARAIPVASVKAAIAKFSYNDLQILMKRFGLEVRPSRAPRSVSLNPVLPGCGGLVQDNGTLFPIQMACRIVEAARPRKTVPAADLPPWRSLNVDFELEHLVVNRWLDPEHGNGESSHN
jgi:hypothetical protein